MASEYCWMEPANGCRICMRILSGERARLPGFGLTEGSLVATCGALRLHLDILQLGNGTQNYRDSDGIDRYPGASGPRLHIGFRRRCTMASIQPGLNLRKATFYEGENCGGLHQSESPKMLKLKTGTPIGKAYGPEEKARLIENAKEAQSPHIYPALMIALNTGMRDAEIKTLTWGQLDLQKRYLAVSRSKTEAGEGRTIPLNSALYDALAVYADWYILRFGELRPEWYVFPFGRPRPNDPTRPVTSLKTAWRNLRKKANVTGRWHDNRHTLITDLAESGASDQTIMDIAGHVSKQMLKHYSHIRMEAKRTALESIVQKQPAEPVEAEQNHAPLPTVTQQIEGEYPQKSPQSGNLGKVCGGKKERKSLKRIGSSGRIRTYNPSVNSPGN